MPWFGLKAVIYPVLGRLGQTPAAKLEVIFLMEIDRSYREDFYGFIHEHPPGTIMLGNHLYRVDLGAIVTAPLYASGPGLPEARDETVFRFEYWEHGQTGEQRTDRELVIDQDGDWWANYTLSPIPPV